MKKFKKTLATLMAVACTASALCVPMSVSAMETNNMTLEKIGTYDLRALSNPELEGTYTNSADYSSFIAINVNGNNICSLENVYSSTESKYVRGQASAYTTANNDENGYFTATLNGNYLTRKGKSGSWSVTNISYGQISGTLYAVKNWANVIQYYVIKIAEGTDNEQVFIQG